MDGVECGDYLCYCYCVDFVWVGWYFEVGILVVDVFVGIGD